ncbi:hypothetical protein [Micromonospora sp. NPDC126480]|uniref:hypothetical protein n=1 Tax=Micromonospora sp. NPDC126480 TaxID=3155312 RepID=UPI00331E314E
MSVLLDRRLRACLADVSRLMTATLMSVDDGVMPGHDVGVSLSFATAVFMWLNRRSRRIQGRDRRWSRADLHAGPLGGAEQVDVEPGGGRARTGEPGDELSEGGVDGESVEVDDRGGWSVTVSGPVRGCAGTVGGAV